MEKLILLIKSWFRHTTVSGVMSDFDKKINQLEAVVAHQRQEQALQAAKIAKAVKEQDKAQTEANKAKDTIEALKAITNHSNQITLADLKKELK